MNELGLCTYLSLVGPMTKGGNVEFVEIMDSSKLEKVYGISLWLSFKLPPNLITLFLISCQWLFLHNFSHFNKTFT